MTLYAQAWLEYQGSKEYVKSYKAMEEAGMKNKFINNILQSAFTEGWNSKRESDAR